MCGLAYLAGPARDAKERGRTVITIEDPVAMMAPHAMAVRLAEVCTLGIERHQWSRVNVDAARRVLVGEGRAVEMHGVGGGDG